MKKLVLGKKPFWTLTLATFFYSTQAMPATLCDQFYPHWNCNNPEQLKQLTVLNQFIEQNAHKGLVAAFDWDGTLYSEKIPVKGPYLSGQTFSGQAAWLLWSAEHLKKHPNWFPLWRTNDVDGVVNLVNQDVYTEDKTNAVLGDYSKFAQIAQYPAGMTPRELSNSVRGFLNDYPVQKYAFLRMFDLVQHMHDEGFKIWIITGSNPYFVANIIEKIEKTVPYKTNAGYNFGILSSSSNANIEPGHIAGNATKLNKQGRFTLVYNDQFVKQPGVSKMHLARYVVDEAGKALAIQNYIEPYEKAPVVFYAGNSGGDYQAALYVLHHHLFKENGPKKIFNYQSLVLAVDPQQESIGTLQDVVSAYPRHTLLLKLP